MAGRPAWGRIVNRSPAGHRTTVPSSCVALYPVHYAYLIEPAMDAYGMDPLWFCPWSAGELLRPYALSWPMPRPGPGHPVTGQFIASS